MSSEDKTTGMVLSSSPREFLPANFSPGIMSVVNTGPRINRNLFPGCSLPTPFVKILTSMKTSKLEDRRSISISYSISYIVSRTYSTYIPVTYISCLILLHSGLILLPFALILCVVNLILWHAILIQSTVFLNTQKTLFQPSRRGKYYASQ